jgi:hypothetical protein
VAQIRSKLRVVEKLNECRITSSSSSSPSPDQTPGRSGSFSAAGTPLYHQGDVPALVNTSAASVEVNHRARQLSTFFFCRSGFAKRKDDVNLLLLLLRLRQDRPLEPRERICMKHAEPNSNKYYHVRYNCLRPVF